MMIFTEFRDEAQEWCRGRNWLLRVPFLILFAVVLFQYWKGPGTSIFSPVNLGTHELGHLVFAPFGKFISILGGTILQIAVPLLGMWNFYRQKDFFGMAFAYGWLATSLFDAARYVADARAMMLPLVSPFGYGENIEHDWNYLLGATGLLQWDGALAFLLRCAANVLMFVCIVVSMWLIMQMAGTRKALDEK